MNEPVAPAPLFGSVLCGAENDPAGIAARRQAEWLAQGPIAVVPTRELTAHGPDALAERTAAHDLLVLPSEPRAQASPEVLGELAPPHVAVPNAAARTGASLVVAGMGHDAWPPAVVTDLARHTGCSTLAVPAPARVGTRFVRPLRDRELMLT